MFREQHFQDPRFSEDNIKVYIKQMAWKVMEFLYEIQDRD
jgi:hypothetical protein